MTYLHPEVRLNKNGVAVTKHVRPNIATRVRTPVPAPVAKLDVPAAMAALDIICSRVPKPEDKRSPLIREVVNAGMEDDEAVNFLALVYMPQELLEETSQFIMSRLKSARHRQDFFRFANDAYFELPAEEASVKVTNAIRITPEGSRFNGFMQERLDALARHSIDARQPMSGTDILAAQSMIAVLDAAMKVPAKEASKYLQQSSEQNRSARHEYVGITDYELANLVLRSGERYPEIAEVIKERKTISPEFLASVLDNPSPSVSEGIL